MSEFPSVILRSNKVDAVKRFHPWVFSGAIKRIDPAIEDGDLINLYSESGEFLATGFYSPGGSIAVKILSFQPVNQIETVFLEKFQRALALRHRIGVANNPTTTCYRLVNAEGDGLPGLIVDWYNGTAVMQAYSLGMYAQKDLIVSCLQQVYGDALKTVYDKSSAVLSKAQSTNHCLYGDAIEGEVLEYGHRFRVNWQEGQKTGFFVDQREHRLLLSKYATGQQVLNTFCYSGGFSAYAIAAGAAEVDSVDSSAKAIALAEQNVALNNPTGVPHRAIAADVFVFLKDCDRLYDVIVLDPPAFAKSMSARHQAMMAYKRLNVMAIEKLRPGGTLFTFSCSQVVEPSLFEGAITAAAIEVGRPAQILHRLNQPADHPISVFHPEGRYLKGLVLQVE